MANVTILAVTRV